MACARCDFYVPKQSSRAQLLEGKKNLLRLKEEVSLTEDELAAVDEERLMGRLATVATPGDILPEK